MGVTVTEQGRRPRALLLTVRQPVVRCPAGSAVAETPEGSACRCHVEDTTISLLRDPSSFVHFCMGDYTRCPTWQAEKERIAAGERDELIDRDNEPPKTFAQEVREMGGSVEWDPLEMTYYEEA